jgi:hypothetical protein
MAMARKATAAIHWRRDGIINIEKNSKAREEGSQS